MSKTTKTTLAAKLQTYTSIQVPPSIGSKVMLIQVCCLLVEHTKCKMSYYTTFLLMWTEITDDIRRFRVRIPGGFLIDPLAQR
jgi:hypothetical protein